MDAGMVDQMHVVYARRARRRAGKTGQTTIDMGHGFGVGGPAVFQHVLDEVDATARAVELVAERHIGGTGGGAKTAMHALAQDGLGFGHMRIGKLRGRKIGLQTLTPMSGPCP